MYVSASSCREGPTYHLRWYTNSNLGAQSLQSLSPPLEQKLIVKSSISSRIDKETIQSRGDVSALGRASMLLSLF